MLQAPEFHDGYLSGIRVTAEKMLELECATNEGQRFVIRPSLKRTCSIVLAALAAGAVGACSTSDIRGEPAVTAMIGREYRIVGDVDAYGIKNEDRDISASYVTLIPPPGISGPEVAFTKRLSKGQTFRIAAATRRFRAFTNGIDYVVELNGSDFPQGLEVRLALFRGNEIGDTDFNPSLHQRIDK